MDKKTFLYVMDVFMTGGTNTPPDNARNVLALRACGNDQELRKEVLAIIVEKRKTWLTLRTLTQRDWQTKVSKRPQRGNHKDSWAIREKYVRC